MDDQRCSLKKSDNKENTHANNNGLPVFKGFSQKLPPVTAPTLPNGNSSTNVLVATLF